MSDSPQSAVGDFWFRVPRRLRQHLPEMSKADLALLCLVCEEDTDGEGFVGGTREIAEACGIKPAAVCTASKRLESWGLIPTPAKGRGNQKTRYFAPTFRGKLRSPNGTHKQEGERSPNGTRTEQAEHDLRSPDGTRQRSPNGHSPHTPLLGSKNSSSDTKTTPNSDDERRLQRTGTETPREEFILRLQERHGTHPNPTDVLEVVNTELEKGAIEFGEFLDWDERHTTAPSRLENPTGHYRRLAQKVVRQKAKEAKQRIVELGVSINLGYQTAMIATPERCTICSGLGRLGSEYCTCPMGRDLKKAESRQPTEAAKAS